MSGNLTEIAVGTILLFEHGEYSDFSYTGPFRVAKKIDKVREAEAYRAQWTPKDEWQDKPDNTGFVIWMNANGFLEEVDSYSWHIGSYSEFEP